MIKTLKPKGDVSNQSFKEQRHAAATDKNGDGRKEASSSFLRSNYPVGELKAI